MLATWILLLSVSPLLSATPESTVVVELFTSQGCSSCPPADRLLSELEETEGIRVIPLSFHVDYWNYIGWTDPFSSAEWSQRQRSYAEALEVPRSYTPQLVVNGESHCVGSDESEVRAEIRRAAKRKLGARVEIRRIELAENARSLEVALRTETAGEKRAELFLALFEKNLETSVSRGENARRSLHNDYVVRSWVRVITVEKGRLKHGARIALEDHWKLDQLGIAAIVQDSSTMRILGADSRDVRPSSDARPIGIGLPE